MVRKLYARLSKTNISVSFSAALQSIIMCIDAAIIWARVRQTYFPRNRERTGDRNGACRDSSDGNQSISVKNIRI